MEPEDLITTEFLAENTVILLSFRKFREQLGMIKIN